MAKIFVSHNSTDRAWAEWIHRELIAAGHEPHTAALELKPGDHIGLWMMKTMEIADHLVSVVTPRYLEATAAYSRLELSSAIFFNATWQRSFLWPVVVEPCSLPRLISALMYCELYGYSNDADARARFHAYISKSTASASTDERPEVTPPPVPPIPTPRQPGDFPGRDVAQSNIRCTTPRHFVGRDALLAEIETTLKRDAQPLAAVALRGMPGVGKSTAAVAFAERHRRRYRATWQLRAESAETLQQDLVALGIRLGWIRADDGSGETAPAEAVIERLRDDGHGILLIYDNAVDAARLQPFLPQGGEAHVIITSNALAWNAVADTIDVETLPRSVATDFLLSRTKSNAERPAAEALADRLGYLPLALEVAAAYCERLKISPHRFKERLDKLPVPLAYAQRHARGTIWETFNLIIAEAEKLHPAAGALVEHVALLAPEPVPLMLFEEGGSKLGEPLASLVAQGGLEDAVAALLTFAIVDRVQVPDERTAGEATDCIQLHRLMREVAAERIRGEARSAAERNLIAALEAVYPEDTGLNLSNWPRARRLDAHAWALVGGDRPIPAGAEAAASRLMDKVAAHCSGSSSQHEAFGRAKSLLERAYDLRKSTLGDNSPAVAKSLVNLALFTLGQGDTATALAYAERALKLEKAVVPTDEVALAEAELTMARVLRDAGRPEDAREHCDRALAIHAALDPDGYELAYCLTVSARIDTAMDRRDLAIPKFERASEIFEEVLGPDHPATGTSLINLAGFRERDGDYSAARALIGRALEIHRKTFGEGHRLVAYTMARLGGVHEQEGDWPEAITLFERAAAINAQALPLGHFESKWVENRLAALRARVNAAQH